MYLFSLCYFTPISRVSVFDFEQVSYIWVTYAFFPNFRCCLTRYEKEANATVRKHIASCLKYAPDRVDSVGRKGEPSSNNKNQKEDLE